MNGLRGIPSSLFMTTFRRRPAPARVAEPAPRPPALAASERPPNGQKPTTGRGGGPDFMPESCQIKSIAVAAAGVDRPLGEATRPADSLDRAVISSRVLDDRRQTARPLGRQMQVRAGVARLGGAPEASRGCANLSGLRLNLGPAMNTAPPAIDGKPASARDVASSFRLQSSGPLEGTAGT